MPFVTLPYAYVDGDTLDPDGHNDNIYDSELATGDGIMSTVNGGLTIENLNSGFKVQADHVLPGEVFRGHQEFQYSDIDIFSDAISSDKDNKIFVPIAGCALRVYFPYAVSAALWQWSCFASVWRPRIDGTSSPYRVVPNLSVEAHLDGAALEHTRRGLPRSFLVYTGGTSSGTSYEERAGLHFDMSHLAEGASAGWHDLVFKVFAETVDTTENIQTFARSVIGVDVPAEHQIYSRLTAGIRNARVLTIL